jgi:hypothetical protein
LGELARLRGISRYGERWKRGWELVKPSDGEAKAVWRDIGVLRKAAALPLDTDQHTYMLPDAETVWWWHTVKGTSLGFTYGDGDERIVLVSIRRWR